MLYVVCRLPMDLPEAHRVLILQMLLKVADLGHLSHPFALHKVPFPPRKLLLG